MALLDQARTASATPEAAARSAGLRYVSDDEPGLRRKRSGRGFSYIAANGVAPADASAVARIKSLAIPPAWSEVWICARPDGHLQATGRDARGRKQYRYHPAFRDIRESTKYERMPGFAAVLPAIRAAVRRHMALPGLPRDKIVATVVHLLDTTLIRIGNDDYARQNNSYGLTTLRSRHVVVDGSEIRFSFTGKSGKQWSLKIRDRRVAKIIKACQELPGQELLQYLDAEGKRQSVNSGDVNDYLRQVSGQDFTAKDFRTWAGTVLAAVALAELPHAPGSTQAKKSLRAVIQQVAARLGNTVTICRKCYVHPRIVNAFLGGTYRLDLDRAVMPGDACLDGLRPEEIAVATLLRARPANKRRATPRRHREPRASVISQQAA
jgi:DNA topoisomerase-1